MAWQRIASLFPHRYTENEVIDIVHGQRSYEQRMDRTENRRVRADP